MSVIVALGVVIVLVRVNFGRVSLVVTLKGQFPESSFDLFKRFLEFF